MTNLLKKAIEEVERLPKDEQDAIAASILDEVSSEHTWDNLLKDPRTDSFLRKMGENIQRQEDSGEITSGDEFLKRNDL